MIQQVAFEVPAGIALDIASGKYVQWGGVVRDNAGRIVCLLKPADVQNGANKALRIADQGGTACEAEQEGCYSRACGRGRGCGRRRRLCGSDSRAPQQRRRDAKEEDGRL